MKKGGVQRISKTKHLQCQQGHAVRALKEKLHKAGLHPGRNSVSALVEIDPQPVFAGLPAGLSCGFREIVSVNELYQFIHSIQSILLFRS